MRGVDLDVPDGQVTALVGPSGCGKTSLLRAVAGFEAPSAGSIVIAGRTVAGPGVSVPPESRRVGMVFQENALFPTMTVAGNVGYGVGRGNEREGRIDEILGLVGLRAYRDRYPDELSGGEQQRIALARALAAEPAIVLLDEPFASLDPALREQVRDDVRGVLDRSGTTAILVTHDHEVAFSFADRVVVMSDGRILQAGTPGELYRRPASAEVARIIRAGQLLPCRVEGRLLTCALGELDYPAGSSREPFDGLVLVRPEDLLMFWATEADRGARGRVVRQRFYGHDIVEDVKMDDGTLVCVRLSGSAGLPVGTPVRIRLRAPEPLVFPAGC